MKKTNKRLFFANLRNEKFLFCCIIAAIIITATIACRKNFSEQTIVNLNEEFSSKTVREWYYASFKASAEFASFDQKKNGLKIPDWKNGIKARIANWDVMEFPLIRAKSSFSIPNATSMTDADCKRIRDASLSRLLFIKWKGQVGVREIEYTPDLNYLKKKPFYGSNVVSVNEMGDFTGTIIVKDWATNVISIQTVVDGKTIRTGKKKVAAIASNAIANGGATTNNYGSCMQYCTWQQDCDMTIYGDGYYTTQCDPEYNTGDCWTEGDCSGDPDPTPDPCEIYGCPDPNPDPPPPPPPPNPCADAQPAANNAKTLATNSNYTTAKTAIQTAAADGNEHGVTFGRDANGNITVSGVTTGGNSNGGVPNIPGGFADMHNHPYDDPPSSGDIYGFFDISNANNAYQTRYIITPNGTVYALVITNLQLAIAFNANHPRVPAPAGTNNEPAFPSNIVDEIDQMKGWGGATDEMALAFILDEYHSGMALLKQDSNGNFKRLGTSENVDANGNKTYTPNNCP